MNKTYNYGMKERGYSLSAQPMKGLIGVKEDRHYYNVLTYNRPLTNKEIKDYELEAIEGEDIKMKNDLRRLRHTLARLNSDRMSLESSKKVVDLSGINEQLDQIELELHRLSEVGI